MKQLLHGLAVGAVLAATACGATGTAAPGPPGAATAPPPATPAQPTARPAASPTAATTAAPTTAAPEPGPGGASFERIHTGQAEPTLVVINAYPRSQHVLIDGRHAGEVSPTASATFEVTVGVHTVTCADQADGLGNPSSITETFETGYRYRYEIRTR